MNGTDPNPFPIPSFLVSGIVKNGSPDVSQAIHVSSISGEDRIESDRINPTAIFRIVDGFLKRVIFADVKNKIFSLDPDDWVDDNQKTVSEVFLKTVGLSSTPVTDPISVIFSTELSN